MSDPQNAAVWQRPEIVAQFLQNVRGAIPLAIEQIDMMLRLVAAAKPAGVERFLDAGCGDGVLSAAVLDEHPNARGWLLDFSEPMLTAARRQLHSHSSRIHFVGEDLASSAWTRSVQSGAPFDAIVSGLAIHHLPHERKRELYAEIFQLLTPEGIFINIEHVASPTRWTENIWDDYMIDAIFGHTIEAAPGQNRAEVARQYYERRDHTGNVLAPLEVQCDWLREIGFENVDCYLKVLELAVFGGQKPAT
jgi:ubiquinone/menaquinone biosynthesis C-methylase UbiE